jgi:hypothetical protein
MCECEGAWVRFRGESGAPTAISAMELSRVGGACVGFVRSCRFFGPDIDIVVLSCELVRCVCVCEQGGSQAPKRVSTLPY